MIIEFLLGGAALFEQVTVCVVLSDKACSSGKYLGDCEPIWTVTRASGASEYICFECWSAEKVVAHAAHRAHGASVDARAEDAPCGISRIAGDRFRTGRGFAADNLDELAGTVVGIS